MSTELAPQIGRSATQTVHQLITRALGRREGKCSDDDGVNGCEKPAASGIGVTWIIVGVLVGVFVVGGLSVMLFLHLKHKRRNEREDLEDRFHMADYGLDGPPGSSKVGQMPPGSQPKLSLDESLATHGRPSEAISQKRASGLSRGYVNPFVSPADDAASIKSIDLNPKWPSRSDSPAGSQNRVPPTNL